MPVLKHTRPCKSCPFRRESLPGYLGAWTAQEFLDATLYERPMECHETVDYRKLNWQGDQMANAALCAGALTFMRNVVKRPRDPVLAAAVDASQADRELVFANRNEFMAHHNW